MWNIGEKFKNYVMGFSSGVRRNRELENFREEIVRLRNMDEDELNFEYIELKSEYEHKKNMSVLYMVSIALGVLMGVWSKFFSFMEKALQYAAASGDNSAEVTKISFMLSSLTALFVTLVILFLLFSLSNDIKIIQKRIMTIESVRKSETTEDI